GGGAPKSASDLYNEHADPSVTAEQIIAEAPAGTAAKGAEADAKLAKTVSTDKLVSEGGFKLPDGTYTPERTAGHNKILNDIFTAEAVARATPPEGQKPTITFLGGRGGSGKSWFTREGGAVDAKHAIVLNSDDIKAALPEYRGWNAGQLHEESTDVL